MSISKIHTGSVKNGKFLPDDVPAFKQAFYGHEGKRVHITVERARRSRSSNQNRYYHGVVVELLSIHCGYTHDEMHACLKYEFLRGKGKNGMSIMIRSTTSLSTAEFEDYLEKIRQWASIEMNLFIPDPNECEY